MILVIRKRRRGRRRPMLLGNKPAGARLVARPPTPGARTPLRANLWSNHGNGVSHEHHDKQHHHEHHDQYLFDDDVVHDTAGAETSTSPAAPSSSRPHSLVSTCPRPRQAGPTVPGLSPGRARRPAWQRSSGSTASS